MIRRRTLLATPVLLLPTAVRAQAWPSRPISMIVAFATTWFFSVTDKSQAASEERARFLPQFIRSQTGLGASGAVAH